jgi:hypothetical protein
MGWHVKPCRRDTLQALISDHIIFEMGSAPAKKPALDLG